MWIRNQAKSNQFANPSLEYVDERLHDRNMVINWIRSCDFTSQKNSVPHLQPSHAMLTITTKAPCNSIFCAVHRHPCGGRKRARAKELRAAAKAEAAMSCRFGLTFVENSEIGNGCFVRYSNNIGSKPDNKDIITADSTTIATTCNNRSPVELTLAGTKVPAWSTVAVTDWMWHPRGHRVPPIALQSRSCFVLNPDQA